MKCLKLCIDEPVLINNPYEILSYTDEIFIHSLFDGLVCYDERGKIVPLSCSKYRVVKKEKKLYFYFSGKKWSNGDLVTAEDFERMFKNIITNHQIYACSELLTYIKKVESYYDGAVDIDSIGVSAKNSEILEIELELFCDDFLNILCQPMFVPIHNDSELNDCYRITNGTFYLEKNDKKSYLFLKKNKHKFDKSNVDALELHVVKNYKKQEMLFLDDRVDVTCATLYNEKERLLRGDDICTQLPLKYYMFISKECMNYLKRNERHELYERIKVYNFEIPCVKNSVSFLPECFNYADSIFDKYNDKKDIRGEKSKEHISLLYSNYYPSENIASAVAEVLIDFGYRVDLKEIDHREIYERIQEEKYDVAIPIISAAYYSPISFLTLFIDDNRLEEKAKMYNELIEKYFLEKDYDNKTIDKMLEILNDKLPIIPICSLEGVYQVKPWINDFRYDVRGYPIYDCVRILD